MAQLYIGDPALAGEPPRQLEGFHRVTLQPHQSQTVTFTITGHELSYFNTAANGWTLPTGRFSLYVGDSSALTALPLRGNLNVTKTIGNRYVRLTAPTTVEPGATFTAKAQFVNQGNLPITDGTVRFGVPSGWTFVPLAGTPVLSLAPGQSATRYFRVTTPESAEGEVGSLTVQLTSAGTDDAGDLSASATVSVPGPITVTAAHRPSLLRAAQPTAEVAITSHMSQAVVVDLTPSAALGCNDRTCITGGVSTCEQHREPGDGCIGRARDITWDIPRAARPELHLRWHELSDGRCRPERRRPLRLVASRVRQQGYQR